jgi:hypothetical protein
MQILNKNGPVIAMGQNDSFDFGIASNAKMFRILSDTMYKDKPGSIVREISCNCLDAHSMNGNDERPFVIHLPDQFEPWISFRDFGPGLSPDNVKKIFCVYGESTKDQSNDSIGAFGLGAKTPFAYTDQFNVTSIHAGKKYLFAAMIGENGIPSMMLMDESDTTEESGVEVNMAVQPADFRLFYNAVKMQLAFFKVKPILNNNNSNIVINNGIPDKVSYSNDKVIIINSVEDYYAAGNHSVTVLLGPVAYPLDTTLISQHLDSKYSRFLSGIYSLGAFIKFNIGEIGVTASREGIDYNKSSIESIVNVIKETYKSVKDTVKSSIDSFSTVYEKVCYLNTHSSLVSLIEDGNGIDLDVSPAKFDRYQKLYYFNINQMPEMFYSIPNPTNPSTQDNFIGVSSMEFNNDGTSTYRNGNRWVPNDKKVVVVLRDKCSTPISRIKELLNSDNTIDKIIVLRNTSPELHPIAFDDNFISKLKDYFGGFSDIRMASSLPLPAKVVVAGKRAKYCRPTAYIFAPANDSYNNYGIKNVNSWGRVTIDLDEYCEDNNITEAVYIEVNKQQTNGFNSSTECTHFDALFKAGKLSDMHCFGIRTNDIAKLEDSSIKWVEFHEYIKNKVEEVISDNHIKRSIMAKYIIDEYNETTISLFISNLMNNFSDKMNNTRYKRLYNFIKHCENYSNESNDYNLNNLFSINIEQSKVYKIFESEIKRIKKEFALINYIIGESRYSLNSINNDMRTDNSFSSHILNYITTNDSYMKRKLVNEEDEIVLALAAK